MRPVRLVFLALAACGGSTAKELPPPPVAVVSVAIASPDAGAELLASEHPTITVTGTVTADIPDDTLAAWVNGTRVDISPADGSFKAEIAPEVGINHIKVEASDGVGDPDTKELDVLWAPAYLSPLTGATGFDLPGALELRLGQRFFDARLLGTSLDRTTKPVVAHDVASALELVLWQVDLAGLLGAGGLHVGQPGASLDLTIPSATPSNIVVDARISDSPRALDVTIDLLGVFLQMSGTATLASIGTLTIEGGVRADLRATVQLTIGTAADGSIDVQATGITAGLGPLVAQFTGQDGDRLNALFALAGEPFRGLIEGLVSSVIPQFTDKLPPLLETLLGATDQLLNNIQFTLDTGIGKPVTLQLDGRMGALAVAAGATSGHITVRQDLTVRTTGDPVHAGSRGAPRVDASTDPPVLTTAGMHLMMRQDFLNALLHALWNAGLLEGQLSLGGLTVTVSAKLPPVVRATPASSACKIDGERCDVLLQLGEIEVGLATFGQKFGINASAGARIEVNGGAVSLKIQKVPDLHVWQTSEMGTFTADNVRDLVATLVWPKLFGAIGDNLMIQLPLPDLAALGLGDLAPGLADAQLQLQMRQRPSFTAGQIVLGADLSLSTPLP